MKIFLDFDDVVFNTKKFKNDFRKMFILNGVPGKIFDNYYVDPLDTRAIKTFNPWLQIERINSEIEIDKEKLKKLVNEFISDMSPYVFNDFFDFVKSIKAKNICILSFGEREFQTKKILNSGVEKKIKEIIITENSKADEIALFVSKINYFFDEKIFFLDDRIAQISSVRKRFPKIITILVKRPEGRYQENFEEKFCDFEASNLKEAQEIIRKIA